jgi:hypothetical protein
VNHYLPYFRQQLITCLLSAVYCCWLCLLKVHVEFSPLPLSSSPLHSQHPAISTACPLQFLVYYLGFLLLLLGRGQSVQGAMLVYPRGSCGNTACCLFAHLLACISKQVWSQHLLAWEPSWFLSVTWHGEALYRLGVWGVGVLLIFAVFFLPCVAPASQQDFCFTDVTLSAFSL